MATPQEPENGEGLALLHDFIDRLDELNRALMILYLDDNSYAEIAAILGISETNVATKISRIKRRLKAEIRRRGTLKLMENAMDIEELKALWQENNRKLEASMRLNSLLFAQSNLNRKSDTRSSVSGEASRSRSDRQSRRHLSAGLFCSRPRARAEVPHSRGPARYLLRSRWLLQGRSAALRTSQPRLRRTRRRESRRLQRLRLARIRATMWNAVLCSADVGAVVNRGVRAFFGIDIYAA